MRIDHTSWLIHFVRDRNPEGDFSGHESLPILAGGEVGVDAKAFEVLTCILRVGGLRPSYSLRNGRTTLYGGKPVLCATEMPIYSFAKYAQNRDCPRKVSPYGVAFLKSEFFAAGGRPAIYGLSSDKVTYVVNTSLERVIDPSVLPLAEQYRLVSLSFETNRLIDWTHEREWRWIPSDPRQHRIAMKEEFDVVDDHPGLPLMQGIENGGHFSRIAVIVWTREEAAEIQSELTGYYLGDGNNYGTQFSRRLIEQSFIIVLDELVQAVEKSGSHNMQTIESIESARLVKPIFICEDTEAHETRIREAITAATLSAKEHAEEYIRENPEDWGSCGFGDIVSYSVTSPIIQQMLKMNVASGPFDGKVIVRIDGDWEHRQSILYNEYIANAACKKLNSMLGDLFYCHARAD